MRRWLLLLVNVASALCAGVLLLFFWDLSFWYLEEHIFRPVLRRHYERIGYANADPLRDFAIMTSVYAAVVGLTLPVLIAYVLRLRWFVLAPILIAVVLLVARALSILPVFVFLAAGFSLFVFAATTFVGTWLGERLRARRISV
jgi:hypothetical protein